MSTALSNRTYPQSTGESSADPTDLTYIKFLTQDGRGPYSGFQWPVGEWVEVGGDLEVCNRGIHVTRPRHAIEWLDARCHPVEIRGDRIDEGSKICVRAARLGPMLETWNERAACLLAADFAEHVLHIFEREHPDDTRPRDAIQAARDFAEGKIDDAAGASAIDAAIDAASDAAIDAAWAAARATVSGAQPATKKGDAAIVARNAARNAAGAASCAARHAARHAARDTASDAAIAAAWDAERRWQSDLLLSYLRGEKGGAQ